MNFFSDFRRNLSANSVASSVSSVDQSNQPEACENVDESEKMKSKQLTNVGIGQVTESSLGDSDTASDHSDANISLSPIIEASSCQVPPLRWGTKDTSKSNALRFPILQTKTASPKVFRKKKNVNSATETRQTKVTSKPTAGGKPKLKSFANYSKFFLY